MIPGSPSPNASSPDGRVRDFDAQGRSPTGAAPKARTDADNDGQEGLFDADNGGTGGFLDKTPNRPPNTNANRTSDITTGRLSDITTDDGEPGLGADTKKPAAGPVMLTLPKEPAGGCHALTKHVDDIVLAEESCHAVTKEVADIIFTKGKKLLPVKEIEKMTEMAKAGRVGTAQIPQGRRVSVFENGKQIKFEDKAAPHGLCKIEGGKKRPTVATDELVGALTIALALVYGVSKIEMTSGKTKFSEFRKKLRAYLNARLHLQNKCKAIVDLFFDEEGDFTEEFAGLYPSIKEMELTGEPDIYVVPKKLAEVAKEIEEPQTDQTDQTKPGPAQNKPGSPGSTATNSSVESFKSLTPNGRRFMKSVQKLSVQVGEVKRTLEDVTSGRVVVENLEDRLAKVINQVAAEVAAEVSAGVAAEVAAGVAAISNEVATVNDKVERGIRFDQAAHAQTHAGLTRAHIKSEERHAETMGGLQAMQAANQTSLEALQRQNAENAKANMDDLAVLLKCHECLARLTLDAGKKAGFEDIGSDEVVAKYEDEDQPAGVVQDVGKSETEGVAAEQGDLKGTEWVAAEQGDLTGASEKNPIAVFYKKSKDQWSKGEVVGKKSGNYVVRGEKTGKKLQSIQVRKKL